MSRERKGGSLSDLNEYLFNALDMVTNEDLSGDSLTEAVNRAGAITKIAETILRSGELAVKAEAMRQEYGDRSGHMPLLGDGE